MGSTRYYRFDSGNVILRRKGDKVEKFGKSGEWKYKPHLMSYFMNGEEGLTEISKAEAKRFVEERRK